MKLTTYLRTRHPTVNALTRAEANLLNIPYPLPKGWPEKYGDMELGIDLVDKLINARFGITLDDKHRIFFNDLT